MFEIPAVKGVKSASLGNHGAFVFQGQAVQGKENDKRMQYRFKSSAM